MVFPGHEPTLRRDVRGAIMVAAVFMAVFLVGAVWYVMGVGDSIVYRHRMLEGADEAAFATAVYHARGMNVIAMINIVMAAVLAVLVALKLAQLLLLMVQAIACLLAVIGIGVPLCTAVTTASEVVADVVSTVQPIVNTILSGLKTASDGVAEGMPWLAETKGVVVAYEAGGPVTGGLVGSASMIPGSVEKGLLSNGKSVADAAANAEANGNSALAAKAKATIASQRVGLPVQDDQFFRVCMKAGTDAAKLALLPISSMGISTDAIANVLGNIIGEMPTYFCGGESKSLVQNIGDALTSKGATEKSKLAALGAILSPKNSIATAADSKKSTKMVYTGSIAGDDYYSIWSVVWGSSAKTDAAKSGVSVAAWGRPVGDTAESPLSDLQVAKAEFYYDIPGTNVGFSTYMLDSTWNMRWRARLRRFRPPQVDFGALLIGRLYPLLKVVPWIVTQYAFQFDQLIDERVETLFGSANGGKNSFGFYH